MHSQRYPIEQRQEDGAPRLLRNQRDTMPDDARLRVESLNVYYGKLLAVKNVTLSIKTRQVTAIIGPSGCGKSTFIRCLNRMHELTPGARVEGKVLLDGADLYGPGVDPVEVRRKIGMVFQKPNPFPTMSIYDNVVAGFKLNGRRDRRVIADKVEKSLKWRRSGKRSKTACITRAPISPAGNSSGYASRGPWLLTLKFYSWTNLARPSILLQPPKAKS